MSQLRRISTAEEITEALEGYKRETGHYPAAALFHPDTIAALVGAADQALPATSRSAFAAFTFLPSAWLPRGMGIFCEPDGTVPGLAASPILRPMSAPAWWLHCGDGVTDRPPGGMSGAAAARHGGHGWHWRQFEYFHDTPAEGTMAGGEKAKQGGQGQGRGQGRGQGQEKLHTIQNSQTGETREVSQEEWRTAGDALRADGWIRPNPDGDPVAATQAGTEAGDAAETPVDGTGSSTSGTTTSSDGGAGVDEFGSR